MIRAVLGIYQALLAVSILLSLPVLLLFRRGEIRERLGGGAGAASPGRVWIHAASLGEFEAARPLILAWEEAGSGVIVSCTNAIARTRLADRMPPGSLVRLAPLDFWPCVGRALARLRPSCLVFVETEIWPAWLLLAARRGIPVVFVSARLSDRSFCRYRRLRLLLRPVLRRVTAVGCRTEEDRRRWISIGAPPAVCHVWGNTKYAAGPAPERRARPLEGEAFVLVAGSVRSGEERILELFERFSPAKLRLILVPRHRREVDGWERACWRRRIGCRRLSLTGIDAEAPPARLARTLRQGDGLPPVILVDRIGVLRAFYAAADAAFVGGTWIPIGGHNLFEPAREGVPVFHGPSIAGVRDAAEALERHGGGGTVDSAEALAARIALLAAEPEQRGRMERGARAAAESLAGSVGRTLESLRALGIPPRGGSM